MAIRRLAPLLLVLALAGVLRARVPTGDATAQDPAQAAPLRLSGAERAGTLRFRSTVAAVDQQVVLGAIARARPEARRLIDLVDGLVVVDVAPQTAGVAGVTYWDRRPMLVEYNLGLVYRRLGQLGTDRLVLHELGHVLDRALTPPDLDARLDAQIPAGFGCEDGLAGGCAAREERFAETFAKWAMRGAGLDLNIGYKVPPPASLDAWGAPLAALGR